MESKRITRHIDRLLVDPNNYRFIDRPEYKFIPEDQIADERVQQRTLNFLQGRNNENIKDLISSFTTNGFLDIDQIQVKAVGDKYLVLEGNRRIATLKFLYEEYKKGNDTGKLVESDFKSVPIVEIVGENPVQHLITMGLHHISGKKRWSPINQAQLVYDLVYKHQIPEEDICNSLGITKHALRRSTRTLALIQQYKESDFGDQFEASMYSLFEEVIKNANMKEWIGWLDSDYYATNEKNIYRLFSWISKSEEIERDENGEEHFTTKEPIITKSHEIRKLSEYVSDNKALQKMEDSRSISEGWALSDAIGESRLRNAITNMKSEVEAAFKFSEYMDPSDFDEINKLKDKMDRLIPSSQAIISINEKKAAKYFHSVHNHFENLNIEAYRRLNNLRIKSLSRINIFAGGNNTGKTSILEAFYLLTQLNDINAFLDLEKYRGKFYKEFHSKWIDKNFINDIDLSGCFNSVESFLNLTKEETTEDIEKTNYLSTIRAEARVGNSNLVSSIHLFGNREPELRYQKSQILCQSSFTSPYRYDVNLLRRAHSYAVQEKYFDEVVDFIRINLDNSIEKIEMISDEGESRFMVTASRIEQVIDLTKYGEGLQRIFEIALLMCYCTNGVLCVDEIDSAIHKELLIEFTDFIQKSAERFNVQVMLSTHSKECIDAFLKNKSSNQEITAYALTEKDGVVTCKYIHGDRLEQLIETINFDIR